MYHRSGRGIVLAGSLGFVLLASPAQAEVDRHTRIIASTCFACHGSNGKSAGAIPSLAGLKKGYFVKQLQDFKSGARPATVMHQHAPGYTDAEVASLAEYFSAQK